MRHYELLYIISGKYTEEEAEKIAKGIEDLVKKHGGEITITDNLGNARLAYPIGDAQSGHRIIIEFNNEPEKIKDMDGALKLTPEVVRFQIVSKKVKTAEEIEKERRRQERRTAKPEAPKEPPPKVSLEELDKKLGEILDGEII